jgi:flagellar biosynthesis/type III secretory pathway protein FliH
MNIPRIDSMGKVIFPQDFMKKQEKNYVGNNDCADDIDVSDANLEAEQTADLEENDRQRAEKLWNDGWQAGHRAGYRDALEDMREKSDGND